MCPTQLSDILSAFWTICGESHDVIVVDDGVVAHIVQGFSYAVHVHITGVGNYLLVPFLFRNLSTHVAEMDVENFALFPEVPDALKDIFPRFVAGAPRKKSSRCSGRGLRKRGGQRRQSCRAPVARRRGWEPVDRCRASQP